MLTSMTRSSPNLSMRPLVICKVSNRSLSILCDVDHGSKVHLRLFMSLAVAPAPVVWNGPVRNAAAPASQRPETGMHASPVCPSKIIPIRPRRSDPLLRLGTQPAAPQSSAP